MNSPLAQAFVRGLIGACIAAGVAFFTADSMASTELALRLAGVAFFTTLATRFGAEGLFDQNSRTQRAADKERYGTGDGNPPLALLLAPILGLLGIIAVSGGFSVADAATLRTFTGTATSTINGQGVFAQPATVTISGAGAVIGDSVASSSGPGSVRYDTARSEWSTLSAFDNFAKEKLVTVHVAAASIVNPATSNTVPVNPGAILRITVFDDPNHAGVQDGLHYQLNGTFTDGGTTFTFLTTFRGTRVP